LNVTIAPTTALSGEVRAPPSKALTHRALFGGLLSNGSTIIHNPLSCDDTKATAAAVAALGAKLERGQESWRVWSTGRLTAPQGMIECGESGVTLRFTIPISSLVGKDIWLKGSETLMGRPIEPLIESMKQLGADIRFRGTEVHVKAGRAKGGSVQLPGNISSQFISGLLVAGPLMEEGLRMKLISPLESRGYVSMTIETMKRHGITVKINDDMSFYQVIPGQTYKPTEHTIPGDYSSAAFLIAAAAVTRSKIQIVGLPRDRADPDSAFLDVLGRMGVTTRFTSDALQVEGRALKATNADITNCPDLGPIIAVLGCYAEGETKITGAGRLRYKESDRLSVIESELRALGAEIGEMDGGLLLSGPASLHGGTVDSHDDHRIAMALSIAALNASGPVLIRSAGCVNKSYPTYFDDIRALGVNVIE
jgi:3-phosphoshikimate 1-carboxyvinyltransferase